MLHIAQALFGIFALIALAYALSERRSAVQLKLILTALGAQLLLAFVFLRVPALSKALASLSLVVQALEKAALHGATFMFGYLVTGPPPFDVANPSASFIVAFRVLPLILVVSALSALLFHTGILPFIIRSLARIIQRVFNVSGTLSFSAAASIFFGIIEGPILIRPYLPTMSRSDLFALMVCGMSTVAGTVMVLYSSILEPVLPGALGHILVASVISVPAALLMAHLLVPPDPDAPTQHEDDAPTEDRAPSAWVALMRGIQDGTRMIVAIVATLIVLFALVHLTNQALSLITDLTLQQLVGFVLRPLVLAMGIPWAESAAASELMGTKLILNEFVAYLTMAKLPPETLSPLSRLTLMYGMCGFANLGSLGILVGGLSPLLPKRQDELAQLALRALVAGTLATTLTGAVVHIAATGTL